MIFDYWYWKYCNISMYAINSYMAIRTIVVIIIIAYSI